MNTTPQHPATVAELPAAKPKHTPGPWRRDLDGFIVSGAEKPPLTIADFDCSSDIDIDEREANKALAMAAPQLLEALRDCITDPGSVALSRHAVDDAIRRLNYISETARAALEQASL